MQPTHVIPGVRKARTLESTLDQYTNNNILLQEINKTQAIPSRHQHRPCNQKVTCCTRNRVAVPLITNSIIVNSPERQRGRFDRYLPVELEVVLEGLDVFLEAERPQGPDQVIAVDGLALLLHALVTRSA